MLTFGILPGKINDTFFLYPHELKFNINPSKNIKSTNNYIFILILPWNKSIWLWKQSNTYDTFWHNPLVPDYTYLT